MSQAIKEKSVYADAFRDFSTGAREGVPSWVAHMREGAFGRFEELGFPTTDEEDWKYTNVAPVARKAFRPAALEQVEVVGVETFVSAEARRSRLVFVNGVYSPEHSSLEAIPEQVSVVELGGPLAAGHAELLWEPLGRLSGEGGDAFDALNTAFHGGGALLRVPA